jgi:hypothetical protein
MIGSLKSRKIQNHIIFCFRNSFPLNHNILSYKKSILPANLCEARMIQQATWFFIDMLLRTSAGNVLFFAEVFHFEYAQSNWF